MLSQILAKIGLFAKDLILLLGYPGIFILMAMESMILPMPSELVMPFAGFLAAEHQFNFWLVVLFSSLGSIFGSLLSYALGKYGGNKFVLKYGRYFLLDETDLQKTEDWFQRSGEKTILISRFVPVVRHLISIPAGIGKMNLKKFCIYTIIGATLWNSFLAYLGYLLGRNWGLVRQYSEPVSITVAIILLAGGIYFVYRHVRNKMKSTNNSQIIS
jgi:membrane protein DedA with SNARE-associated domain